MSRCWGRLYHDLHRTPLEKGIDDFTGDNLLRPPFEDKDVAFCKRLSFRNGANKTTSIDDVAISPSHRRTQNSKGKWSDTKKCLGQTERTLKDVSFPSTLTEYVRYDGQIDIDGIVMYLVQFHESMMIWDSRPTIMKTKMSDTVIQWYRMSSLRPGCSFFNTGHPWTWQTSQDR